MKNCAGLSGSVVARLKFRAVCSVGDLARAALVKQGRRQLKHLVSVADYHASASCPVLNLRRKLW